jgi:hypothetical protein
VPDWPPKAVTEAFALALDTLIPAPLTDASPPLTDPVWPPMAETVAVPEPPTNVVPGTVETEIDPPDESIDAFAPAAVPVEIPPVAVKEAAPVPVPVLTWIPTP